MLRDSTVLARVAGVRVIAEHTLVEWPDGSVCRVHQAQHDRHLDDDIFAVRAPAGREAWLVFRAADVDLAMAADLRRAHWHDHLGIVHYSLKQHFADARAFMKAVLTRQAREALQRQAA